MLAVAVIASIFLYIFNKKYLYVLDAEFEDESAVSIILKTGFIFPVKTLIEIKNGFEKKIRTYGYKIRVIKKGENFDITLDGKKIHTVYPLSYYEKTHHLPTGRIFI